MGGLQQWYLKHDSILDIFWNNILNLWSYLKSTMENHPGKQHNHKDYMALILAD